MPRLEAKPLPPTPVWLGRLGLELKRLAVPLLGTRHRGLLSFTFDVPLEPLRPPAASPEQWLFWHRPEADHRLLGAGKAVRLSERGEGRFQRLGRRVRLLQEHWTHINQGRANPVARAFLGFAFDPGEEPEGPWRGFPNLAWVVPSLLLEWRKGHCTLTFSHDCAQEAPPEQVVSHWITQLRQLLGADEDRGPERPLQLQARQEVPDAARWIGSVEAAVAAIRRRERLRKVVLSRTLELRFQAPPDSGALFERLAEDFPGCVTLGARFGGSTLVAATPERLLALEGGEVCSDAIAGTVPGSATIADEGMRRHEHQPVVEAIRAALADWCEEVEAEARPRSLQLHELSHLATPVRARLREGADLFSLLAALHPTPAVGGVPLDEAMAWIRTHEGHRRGWYTGAFGWMGDAERAELSVVLRCGLLEASRLTLFAGAGITEVSVPATEFEETGLKFQVLLDRLLR